MLKGNVNVFVVVPYQKLDVLHV